MKITYAFADGTTSVVEVDDEIGAYIMDSRRQENNDDRRHRYHNYSLDDVTYLLQGILGGGNQIL